MINNKLLFKLIKERRRSYETRSKNYEKDIGS